MSVMESWFNEIDRRKPEIRLDRGQLDFFPSRDILETVVQEVGSKCFEYPTYRFRLTEAICNDLLETRELHTDISQIVLTHGAIGAIDACFRILCKPGDEVLVPLPVWPAVPDLVRLAKARPVFYPFFCDRDLDELPERIAAICSRKTRVLFLNTPHNPTGLHLSNKQINEVLQVARNKGLSIISDEAYESMGLKGEACRLLTSNVYRADEVILILSFSKRFAAPGLRIGIVRAVAGLAKEIAKVSHLQTGGISIFSQEVATKILENSKDFEQQIAQVISERRCLIETLFQRRGVPVPLNRCGLYTFLDLQHSHCSWDVSRRLLNKGIGVVPGEVFGGTSKLRLSLTAPNELLAEGIEKVCEVI